MGKIEQDAKVVRRRTNIQKIVLHTIATAGVLSIALLAPNALQLLAVKERGTHRVRRMNPKYLIDTAFGKLRTKGYIFIEDGAHGKVARLTNEGKRALGKMIATSPDA